MDPKATVQNPRWHGSRGSSMDPKTTARIPRRQRAWNPRRRHGSRGGGVPSNKTAARMGCKRKTDAGTSTALSDGNFHDERSTKNAILQLRIGGADYGSVRIGAFMGRTIIKSEASTLFSSSFEISNAQTQGNGVNAYEYEEHGIELLKAEASLDFLCNLSPHRYKAVYAQSLPEFMLGKTFLDKYIDHGDPVTTIDPKRQYAVRAPTGHPIYENFRVKAFKALLTASSTDEQLSSLGELLYQCHYSYSECGLGSDGTERLVNLVQEIQHRKRATGENGTLFGAKITGGGSGGSVCVIGRNCVRSNEEILEGGLGTDTDQPRNPSRQDADDAERRRATLAKRRGSPTSTLGLSS
ncbi:L-arabinokinase [Nymphaea thermarum]|nr:L-arabinokinase [Nymphaea thermarum]